MKAQKSNDGKNKATQPNRSLALQKQHEYVENLKKVEFDFGLVLGNAFVRGMRDIGYKSTAYALNELNDNAIQAGAGSVHTAFGYAVNNKSQKKPDMLAVIDDGHGMEPTMIRASVLWGGTHREGDRTGFGRYGYGLPSACVSIGKAYSVYSKLKGGDWYRVTVDLDEIDYYFKQPQNKPYAVPEQVQINPPAWVTEYIEKNFENFESGTVILIDKIDRLDLSTTQGMRKELLQDYGITYRNWLGQTRMFVDGSPVEATDPLFTTEGFRFYDLDKDRAEAQPDWKIEVPTADGKGIQGIIKVRLSYMPPTFLRLPEYKMKPKSGKKGLNARFAIRKANNGFIFLREGRQIDVLSSRTPVNFQSNDRYVGIEVDFSASLDDLFSITTAKQQILPKERVWSILDDKEVLSAISSLKQRYLREAEKIDVKDADVDGVRPSEAAMSASEKFFPQTHQTESQERRSEENLESEAQKLSDQADIPFEDAKRIVEEKVRERAYKVKEEDVEGAPFYRVLQAGSQKVLYINTCHRFYSDLYAHRLSSPHVRYSLETLLFVLGACEIRAHEDGRQFYKTEKHEWSVRLDAALAKLEEENTTEDIQVADEEGEVNSAKASTEAVATAE